MSRSGYSEDCDGWALIRWRGAVASAIKGARGQSMLRDLVQALDALPEKRLAADSLVNEDGEFCALGALGLARGMDLAPVDPDDRQSVAQAFGVAEALAAEVMFENDESTISEWRYINVEVCGPMRKYEKHAQVRCVHDESAAARRWHHMRTWAASNIKEVA